MVKTGTVFVDYDKVKEAIQKVAEKYANGVSLMIPSRFVEEVDAELFGEEED